MNPDASNVEDLNIHQITERLSMSCIASPEDWPSIFRNRSFTLCKNDLTLEKRFDSVSVQLTPTQNRTFAHREHGFLEVLSLHTPSVAADYCQLHKSLEEETRGEINYGRAVHTGPV